MVNKSRNEVSKYRVAVNKEFLGCCTLFTCSGLKQVLVIYPGTLAVEGGQGEGKYLNTPVYQ